MSERTERLSVAVRAGLRMPEVRVEPWRCGTDFWADLAYSHDHLLGVVRSARTELRQTTYDGLVDHGVVLMREAAAAQYLSGAGVPVPRTIHVERADPGGTSWSLAEYRPGGHDADLTPQLPQLGRLTRAIHDVVPEHPLLRPPEPWAGWFTERLGRRLRAAGAYTDLPVGAWLLDRVRSILDTRRQDATRLLHMDLRPDNLCVQDGRITAVLDLGNCMVGDPLLELARIRSYGLLTDGFLAGYGPGTGRGGDEAAVLDIYQLDTEALLVTVAAEEVGDLDLQREKIGATRRLIRRLARTLA